MANAMGVHLHAQVPVFGPKHLWPCVPIHALRFGDGGVHSMVDPPWFIAHPCGDVLIVDLNVFGQASVKRWIEGQSRVCTSVMVVGRQSGNVPHPKPKVGQKVNPADGGLACFSDSRPERQAS